MKEGVRPLSSEGLAYAHWVLIDYGDVVAHVFEEETRFYYELEKLWLDAPRVAMAEDGSVKGKKNMTSDRGNRYSL